MEAPDQIMRQISPRQRRRVAIIFRELYEQIVQEIMSLDLSPDVRARLNELRMQINEREPDASAVYRVEMFLIDRLEIGALKLRILTLRELLSSLLSPNAYSNFEQGLIHDLETCKDEARLRGEASGLASRTYRRYALVPAVELQRSALVIHMASCLLVAATLTAIVGWWTPVPVFYPLALVCGALGAAMSVTMRLYQIDPRNDPLLTWLSIEQGKRSIYLSPFLGAAFGLVFLLVVRANVVSGDMFPNFESEAWLGMRLSNHGCEQLKVPEVNARNHAMDCGEAYLQYAKVAVWAFIAGWAERMVPDVLNKLAQQPAAGDPKD